MVERDLKEFKCPQQFVQFKLALRSAQSSKQRITFSLNKGESANDIERFLKKNAYSYNFDKQRGLLLVEPLHV
ncbi:MULTISPECIES: hypothetical protein [unclassified Pseudoalteromonas]|uniref:hypothetical protein n=1 Tax=unclassified Pseudoalteromonas TaxID=194690 RepID=UPI0003FAB138|nr:MULTISPECIES: hypothetical protein [unclassified Pseudoalteromonas]PKH92422.1 hypothetical protein CXF76_06455 [Pseudoalteromonas sp. 78C3]